MKNLFTRRALGVALLAVIAMNSFTPTSRAADEPPTAPLPVTFFKTLQEGKKQNVVVYGTSLSAAAEWPKAMKEYFDKEFPGLVTFSNGASSGRESNWGVANLKKQVLSKNPDLVFIEFSINDSATKHNISLEKSLANLDSMVQSLREQNPKVDIVLQVMSPVWNTVDAPTGKTAASDRPKVVEYYDVYRKYAREHAMPLIDHYPAWTRLQQDDEAKFKKWLPDGTHPIPEASLAVTWTNVKAELEAARHAARAPTTAPAK